MSHLPPAILGIVGAVSQDGQFTNAVYFTSYGAAREGVGRDIPQAVLSRGDEMMSLTVGELEFLDLTSPWLDSPEHAIGSPTTARHLP
jgi:hypothetical protein